jgi:hypothetical protein
MKIWKAKLILLYNDDNTYEIKFFFELQDKEFNLNEKFNEWTHYEDWVMNRIPLKMTIERYHELNEEELEQLEKDMRELMKKQLEYDKELYLKKYEEKLKAIIMRQ